LDDDLVEDPELAAAAAPVAVTTTTEPEPLAEDAVSGPAGTAVAVAVTTATPLWDEPEVVIVSSFPRVVEAGARADVIVKVRTPLASVVVEVATTFSDEAEEELERGDGKMMGYR
jgi:hypothetical protein